MQQIADKFKSLQGMFGPAEDDQMVPGDEVMMEGVMGETADVETQPDFDFTEEEEMDKQSDEEIRQGLVADLSEARSISRLYQEKIIEENASTAQRSRKLRHGGE